MKKNNKIGPRKQEVEIIDKKNMKMNVRKL